MIVAHERVYGSARRLRCCGIDDLQAHVGRQRAARLRNLERGADSGKLRLAARRLWARQRVDRTQHEVGTLSGYRLPAARSRGKDNEGDEGEMPDHSGQNIRYAVAACSPAPRASASWRSSFGAVAYP